MARHDPSTGNDDSSMSILDVFANGMGCVLMLMVVFVLRITASAGRSGEESRPTMVTIAWSTENPPQGAGPSQLKVRVLRDDYHEPAAGDLPQDWRIVSTSGARYGTSSSPERRESVVLLVPELDKNSRWRIQLGIEYSPPPLFSSRDKTHPFEILVDRITERLSKLNKPTERRASRDEILMLVRDYHAFLTVISRYQAKWLSYEARWPSSPDNLTFDAVMHERWQWASDCYGELKDLSYPRRVDQSSSTWYSEFMSSGKLQIAEFEQALTSRIHAELRLADHSGGPVDVLTSRQAEWTSGIESLVADRFSLPMNVSFVGGVGDPIVDQTVVLDNPFHGATGDGWTTLGLLRVGQRHVIQWSWGDVEPDSGEAAASKAPPPASTIIQLSKWDQIVASLNSNVSGTSVITGMDRALALLANLQDAAGTFSKASATDDHTGPAITSLSLMAFFARGHTPDALSSQYRENTIRAIEHLVSISESDAGKLSSGGTGHYAYHHGFGTMALAQGIPHLKRAINRTPLDAADKDLIDRARNVLPRAEQSLELAVKLLLGSPPYGIGPTGGWGYDKQYDDTSVAAVQVKALVEAYYLLPSQQVAIRSSIASAKTFFENARLDYGTYKYRVSDKASSIAKPNGPIALSAPDPVWPARLPGCLLAECYCNPAFLAASKKESWAPGVERFERWTPSADEVKEQGYAHYALYYAAHLRFELRDKINNKDWSQSAADAILAGQQSDGRFAKGTYGTAMAVITLALPLRAATLDNLR